MSVFDWLKKLASSTPPNEAGKSVPDAPRQTGAAALARSPGTGAPSVPAALAADSAAADAAPEMTAAEKKAMVVGGLDFMDAITAHQKWKSRLTSYVAATSTEKLDYRLICRDDQCVLGKWINGQGSQTYGHVPVFSQLKMTHAQFHLAASAIVQLTDEGHTEQARLALRQGDYSKHSVKVQGLISSLYIEVNEAKTPPTAQ
jgi:Chemoreceptor zinc-binding domain